ncbi:MAG: M20 family peptidase [Caldilineae bacterium]|nr:MAG: M20 family peptidase [Caldilineae bacterium]
MPPSDIPSQLKTHLEPRLPAYLDLLEQMVAINSFTENPAGVNALGRLTAAAFAELGFTAETVQAENPAFGEHLILTRPGRTGRKIAFVSHLDTVFPPEEEAAHHFAWRPEGDRIYGPGTVDIKGGTVMMYMVLDALRTVAPDAFDAVTWVLLLNAAEERLSNDFGALCRERLAGDTAACLVFEGGNLNGKTFSLAVTRKGKADYVVRTFGRGAHAGNNHHQGVNAIVQMAGVIQRIAALTDYRRRLTFNVGTVRGGTVTNRVPHYAEAHVEMRAFDAGVFEEGVAAMLALGGEGDVRSADGGHPGRVEVELVSRTPPWPQNPGTDRLYNVWQQAAQSLGMQTLREHRGGLSDGNHLWHTVPTLDALGPSGGNAHCSERSADGSKDQEFVTVSSFVPKAMLNALAVLRLARG